MTLSSRRSSPAPCRAVVVGGSDGVVAPPREHVTLRLREERPSARTIGDVRRRFSSRLRPQHASRVHARAERGADRCMAIDVAFVERVRRSEFHRRARARRRPRSRRVPARPARRAARAEVHRARRSDLRHWPAGNLWSKRSPSDRAGRTHRRQDAPGEWRRISPSAATRRKRSRSPCRTA